MANKENPGYIPTWKDIEQTEAIMTDEERRATSERIIEAIRQKAGEMGVKFIDNPKAKIVKKIRGQEQIVIRQDDKLFYQYGSASFEHLEVLINNNFIPLEKIIITPNYQTNGAIQDQYKRWYELPLVYFSYETTDQHPLEDRLKEIGLENVFFIPYPEHRIYNKDRGFGNQELPAIEQDDKMYILEGGIHKVDEAFAERIQDDVSKGRNIIITPTGGMGELPLRENTEFANIYIQEDQNV